MPILLDTSFILAFDNEREIYHKQAVSLWNGLANMEYGKYFISDHVFDEIVGVSLRKRGKEKTLDLCRRVIRDIPIINLDEALFDEAWKIFEETNTNLSFTDCTNLVLIKLSGDNTIATFDKAFKDIENVKVIGYEN